jgi:GT2 family glycosyltransferase
MSDELLDNESLGAYVRSLENRIVEIESSLAWRFMGAVMRLVPADLVPKASAFASWVAAISSKQASSDSKSSEELWGNYEIKMLAHLEKALDSSKNVLLDFTCSTPAASVVLTTFNNAHLTLQCLEYLKKAATPLEIIVVDDGSTDQTSRLLSRIRGVRIVTNETKVGYVDSCVSGMNMASLEFSLLLNSAVLVHPEAIRNAISLLESDESVAAVCAKLLGPDGNIQECGRYVDVTGFSVGFLAGKSQDHLGSMHRRPVDYGTSAFLMVRTSSWIASEGFRSEFNWASYQDADLCFRFWALGYKVVFEPSCSAIRVGKTSCEEAFIPSVDMIRRAFTKRHSVELGQRAGLSEYQLAHVRQFRPSFTYIDSRLPREKDGQGFPRARRIVDYLEGLDVDLTIVSTAAMTQTQIHEFREGLSSPSTEVIVLDGDRSKLSDLRERLRQTAICWVSRQNNFDFLFRDVRNSKMNGAPIVVYDTETLSFLRKHSNAAGTSDPQRALKSRDGKRELARIRASDLALVVSKSELDLLTREGEKNVLLLGYTSGTEAKLEPNIEASSQLFVGRLTDPGSPNWDSLKWYLEELLPIATSGELELSVVGSVNPWLAKDLITAGVSVQGPLENLAESYSSARIFIAPTRSGSGIPLKVIDAVAGGLFPLVTPLLAQQLGIPADSKSVCNTPEEFISRLREFRDDRLLLDEHAKIAAIMKLQFSKSVFENQIRIILKGKKVVIVNTKRGHEDTKASDVRGHEKDGGGPHKTFFSRLGFLSMGKNRNKNLLG